MPMSARPFSMMFLDIAMTLSKAVEGNAEELKNVPLFSSGYTSVLLSKPPSSAGAVMVIIGLNGWMEECLLLLKTEQHVVIVGAVGGRTYE